MLLFISVRYDERHTDFRGFECMIACMGHFSDMTEKSVAFHVLTDLRATQLPLFDP